MCSNPTRHHLPQQSPLLSSSTFPSSPSMQPAVGPPALNKPRLCKGKKPPQRKETLHQPTRSGRRQERGLWEGRRVRVSPQHPQAGCCHQPGHSGLPQHPAASPCPVCWGCHGRRKPSVILAECRAARSSGRTGSLFPSRGSAQPRARSPAEQVRARGAALFLGSGVSVGKEAASLSLDM